jgi:hypothetical protein
MSHNRIGLHGLLQGGIALLNLTIICDPIVYKMWDPRRLTTLWASRPDTGIVLLNLTAICEQTV